MSAPQAFSIDIPQSRLDRIRARVAEYEWHEMPENGGWEFGANLDYMKELCAYWLNAYDWRKWERELNRFPQYTVDIEGQTIHYIIEKGSGANPRPLIISHGWPGSVFEFLHVIEPLAHPERFGGDEKDAFDVIVPSLPGYGFSGKPRRPIGPRKIAKSFDRLMSGVLGYKNYIAQGGDWGSIISGWMGYDYGAPKGACAAVHLNMYGLRSVDAAPKTPEEIAFAQNYAVIEAREMGYFREQSTKPQTLSYGMMDSPVGACAWIVEKFHGWSDLKDGRLESVYSKDQLLTNVMIYLVTGTFNTATWLYRGLFDDGDFMLGKGERVKVPVGVANFPKDLLPWPPRSMAEKTYAIAQWSDIGEGGHFAAMEKPDKFIADIRAFAGGLR
ncbi:MAG: epoxide hydrolase family protein [Pseudomonadota bacterium]|jgi:pimeloyl-ACP methyl ester carboxylesterase|nr:epoxide hydrolase [Alphaproteobacteria bacterium]